MESVWNYIYYKLLTSLKSFLTKQAGKARVLHGYQRNKKTPKIAYFRIPATRFFTYARVQQFPEKQGISFARMCGRMLTDL